MEFDGRTTTTDIGFAIWRLKCFYEAFVQGATFAFY